MRTLRVGFLEWGQTMNIVGSILIFIVTFAVAAAITLGLAMAIGWALKFIWKTNSRNRNKLGLVILAAIEVGLTAMFFSQFLPTIPNAELQEMIVPNIIVPTGFRLIIYYATWKFFDEDEPHNSNDQEKTKAE